ncbi:hypothetical protein O181_021323 [Austropuccinia psidii MF-1]|uniref:Uncharacterized protein n=1 Tax=Austropuccinia psidii MF-1 TaxID=1389203 RepID=A0A9Q3CD60_9BASI|nr:hypothetical protein [Austropuccinia psidii MF-1]
MLVQDPDTSHTSPYACPGSQRFTHKALHCKSLCRGSLPTMPTIPYPCPGSQPLHLYRFRTIKIIAYAGAALQQLQHFLMQVHAPRASHKNPYDCAGSQQFKQLLTPGQASENSHANPYACTGSQHFTCKVLMLVQVPDNSDHSLCLGSLLTILKIPYTNKINIL